MLPALAGFTYIFVTVMNGTWRQKPKGTRIAVTAGIAVLTAAGTAMGILHILF